MRVRYLNWLDYLWLVMDILELMKAEMLRRKYSSRTIKTYIFCVKKFLEKCHKDPRSFCRSDIKDYLNQFVIKDAPGNTINIHLNALKFMYEQILNKRFFVNIRYSKVPKKFPHALSKAELISLLSAIDNPKHKLLVKLLYSAGLRVGEAVSLKACDLEPERNIGWVRGGKGNKDRLFIIAETIKEELKEFVNGRLSNEWVFKGCRGHLSTQSAYLIVKRAARKAEIKKNVHPHMLRHSFATHLIEDGYDVAAVQFLLGHTRTETTMVYVHMASPRMISVKSPLDSLLAENGMFLAST